MNVARVGTAGSIADLFRTAVPPRARRDAAEVAAAPSPTNTASGGGAAAGLAAVIDLHVRIEIGENPRSGREHGHEGRGPLRSRVEGLRRQVFHAVKDLADELGPLTKEQKKEVRTALREFAHEVRDAYREAVESGKPLDPEGPLAGRIEKALEALVAAMEKAFGGSESEEPPITTLPVTGKPAIDEIAPVAAEVVESTPAQPFATTRATEASRPTDPVAALPDVFRALIEKLRKWLGGQHPVAPPRNQDEPVENSWNPARMTYKVDVHAELTIDATA